MRLCHVWIWCLEVANKHRHGVELQFEAIPSKDRMILQVRRQVRQFEVRSGHGCVGSDVDRASTGHRCDIEAAPVISVKAVAMRIGRGPRSKKKPVVKEIEGRKIKDLLERDDIGPGTGDDPCGCGPIGARKFR